MATVTASKTWVSGETVTPAGLNLTAAPTVAFSTAADTDDATLEVSGGKFRVKDGGVTNAKLATGIDASKLTTGTLPIARVADAAVTPAKLSQPLTLRTAVPTTSGTSIDFTDIPSWVKRITVMLSGVSSTASSNLMIQLGDSGGFEISDYTSLAAVVNTSAGTDADVFTTGLGLTRGGTASTLYSIVCTISLLNPSTNTWVSGTNGVASTLTGVFHGSGVKSLSGTLDRIRLTTVGGTGTFDAGTANIMYEG
jgi:hypothetical protein